MASKIIMGHNPQVPCPNTPERMGETKKIMARIQAITMSIPIFMVRNRPIRSPSLPTQIAEAINVIGMMDRIRPAVPSEIPK